MNMAFTQRKITGKGKHRNNVAVVDSPLQLSSLEKCLLNEYQRGFPLCAAPYAQIAEELDVSEEDVLATLESLSSRGLISRVGPVFTPRRASASTLAAMSVPADRLAAVAGLVSNFEEVNHNYEREHDFNLWFVVTAEDETRVLEVLDEIESGTGIVVLNLPLEDSFFIDLGFPLWC